MEGLQACVKTPFAAVPIAAKRPIVEKPMLVPKQPKLFGQEIEQSELVGQRIKQSELVGEKIEQSELVSEKIDQFELVGDGPVDTFKPDSPPVSVGLKAKVLQLEPKI